MNKDYSKEQARFCKKVGELLHMYNCATHDCRMIRCMNFKCYSCCICNVDGCILLYPMAVVFDSK